MLCARRRGGEPQQKPERMDRLLPRIGRTGALVLLVVGLGFVYAQRNALHPRPPIMESGDGSSAYAISKALNAQGSLLRRFGGDEFLLPPKPDLPWAVTEGIAESVIRRFKQPLDVEGRQISIQANVGMVFILGDLQNVDEVVHDADLALYEAKAAGGGHALEFSPELLWTEIPQLSGRKLMRCLDEFGTGTGASAPLMEAQFEQIKLGASVVSGSSHRERSQGIAEAAQGLAEQRGSLLLADGIETQSQLDTLLR